MRSGRIFLASCLAVSLGATGAAHPAMPRPPLHVARQVSAPELGPGAARPEAADVHGSLAARWRDHILPTPAESAWERIPWIPSFAGGVLAADEAQRPLLLWVMNGHPLGCT